MQAIIDACKQGRLDAKPCVVISNNSDSMALARAGAEGIPRYHISASTHPGESEDRAILRTLQAHDVDTVILAGYMKRNSRRDFYARFDYKFGGMGLYGRRVHEAVLNTGEKVTGVTVHVIDEDYDTGPVLNQVQVPVMVGDTADSLAERVLRHEHLLYVETLRKISEGTIALPTP